MECECAQHWSRARREQMVQRMWIEHKSDGDERDARRVLHGKYAALMGAISMDGSVSVARVKRRITMRLHKNQNMHFWFTHCLCTLGVLQLVCERRRRRRHLTIVQNVAAPSVTLVIMYK